VKRIRVYEFGGPEVLKLEDATDPHPGPGEVLVRVHAAGVNPYDAYMRSGQYGARTPILPFTPGSDAAGIVEAVGSGVTEYAPGDRVYTTGTLTGAYAELTLCGRTQLQPLPSQVGFSEGAGVYVPYATAYRALFQIARAVPTDTALVHGASGGVGIAALQFARAAGLTIIGTAGSEAGMQLIREHGAHHAVNHGEGEHAKRVLGLTDGRGVNVILEMLANINLSQDLQMLAAGGRVVVIGSRGNVEITPRDLMLRDASITGMMLWNVPPLELARINRAVGAGLESGYLRPYVGARLPLAEAAQAHQRISQRGSHGKIILVP